MEPVRNSSVQPGYFGDDYQPGRKENVGLLLGWRERSSWQPESPFDGFVLMLKTISKRCFLLLLT